MPEKPESVAVRVTARLDASLTVSELADALMSVMLSRYVLPGFDDAGCDWQTLPDGSAVIVGGYSEWVATKNPNAVHLMNAYNVLKGYPLHPEPDAPTEPDAELPYELDHTP